MANPAFVANFKVPMTEKPSIDFTPQSTKLYFDIFNIQNTIRLLLVNFVEEAPSDGNIYGRKDGQWVVAGGGGGGGIPEAPVDGKTYGRKNANWTEITSGAPSTAFNLYITGNMISMDNNYRGYTVFARLSSGALLNKSTKWKFSMWLQAAAAFNIGPIKLLKTLPGSTAVVSSSDVTIGGSTTPLVTPPSSSSFRIDTYTITTALDGANDVWIAVYFPSTNAVTNNVGIIESTSTVKGFYVSGNFTGNTTIPGSATTSYLVSNIQQVP